MKTAYSPKKRNGITFKKKGVTVQYHKDQCDINNIIAKHSNGGPIFATTAQPRYDDFSDVVDYQTAQNALISANNAFQALPSDIRAYFNNSPQQFVEFCSDEKNIDEMRRLKLAPDAKEIPAEILEKNGTKSAD